MTKEEILAMKPGNELDDMVASEIMEWQQGGDEGEVWLDKEDHYTDYFVTGRAPGISDCYWKPSTDISAAWQVLDELKKKWDCVLLVWDVGVWDIHLENYTTRKEFYLGTEAGETYEKIPEAICKAALIAKIPHQES